MKSVLLLLSLIVCLNSNLFSQDVLPELVTDRPDKTESASVVPAGWLQIETGFEFSSEKFDYNSELNSTNIAGTLFRFGVVDKLELRMGGTFLTEKIKTTGVEKKTNGLADLMLGAKYSFVNEYPSIPDIALLFHLFLPVGGEEFKPSKTEPQAVISIAKSLTDFISLGTNIGRQYNSSDEKINYLYTITAGFSLSEKIGSFIEIYSELYPSAKPFISFGAGFTYLLLSNLQLDISGGNGLFHNSKFWYLGTGLSIRIPR